jgi:DMSO/TMAO reductase YedYZ heme-binding membrane subunit
VTLTDVLLIGCIVALVLDGILLVWTTSLDIREGLGVACFALAAWAAAGITVWARRP